MELVSQLRHESKMHKLAGASGLSLLFKSAADKIAELEQGLTKPMSGNNYTCQDLVLERLKREYDEHGSLIIAFDFDNTIYDYHSQGLDMSATVSALRKAASLGFEMYAFTAQVDTDFVKQYVKHTLDIEDVTINQASVEFGVRKPFFSLLLDDRAGLDSALRTLNQINCYAQGL